MSDADSVNLTHYEGKYIIGLTGNIATGKSAVMRLARDRRALTIDADLVVRDLLNGDEAVQEAIAQQFSSRVRQEDGRIDREVMGQIVFSDPEALALLESIIHPAVRKEVDRHILASDADYILIEAIKLLEGNLSDSCHQVWVTRCDRKVQLDRLRVCRGLETNVAATRIKAQSPQEEKIALADIVIDTNGLMKETAAQFEMAWSRLPDPVTVEAKPRLLAMTIQAPVTKAGTGVSSDLSTEGTTSAGAALEPLELPDMPEDLQVRRARPSDIPSILLLIRQATDGAKRMKRAEILMALSERGYLIGQIAADISTIAGWSIDSQVGCVDELYIHPAEMIPVTGSAVLAEVEKSANAHVCQIIVVFLPNSASEDLRRLAATHGYRQMAEESLANNWKEAIAESQPDDTFSMIKILRDTRKK